MSKSGRPEEQVRPERYWRNFVLEKNPGLGADLGGGLRKIRMAITSKGHGKRGGARVITFTVIVSVEEAVINLLTIYDKSERESIKRSEILALLEKNGLR